jgi:hypothetical protein
MYAKAELIAAARLVIALPEEVSINLQGDVRRRVTEPLPLASRQRPASVPMVGRVAGRNRLRR